MRKKRMNKTSKIVAFVSLLWAIPFLVLAQTSGSTDFDNGLKILQGLFPTAGIAGTNTVVGLIAFIISILLFLGGSIAVLFIIIGGYWYITAEGNEERAEKGRKALINAIIGIIIVLLSYVIVTVISNLVGQGVS